MNTLNEAAIPLIRQAHAHRHRQLFVCTGDQTECLALAYELLLILQAPYQPTPSIDTAASSENALWIGGHCPPTARLLKSSAARAELGSEFTCVTINAFDGFDCEAFAALCGTIRAGGALVLIIPGLNQWSITPDPIGIQSVAYATHETCGHSFFLERLARMIQKDTDVLFETAGCAIHALPVYAGESSQVQPSPKENLYAEQTQLTTAIFNQLTGTKYRTLLITADRGRGKSTALGLAAARYLNQHSVDTTTRLLVTAPGKRSAQILLTHCQQAVNSSLLFNRVLFCPPDQLLSQSADSILLVDEAASIPLPLLLKFARTFKKVVFASTVQGYEGAGRGFALRFAALLDNHDLSYQQRTISTPIRWSPHDPLEHFCNKSMMLDAELRIIDGNKHPYAAESIIEEVTPARLVDDEELLRSIFGLLTQAHYRTSPLDLRHMLDGNNLRCFIMLQCNQLIGASLIAMEGPIHELALRCGILERRRRPTGHLLPQLLAQYAISSTALDLSIARIVRIAIHPALQRHTLGTQFLAELKNTLDLSNVDAIGAMFAAVPDTLRFWVNNEYLPWHLGHREHASNGYPSISVLHLCNNRGKSPYQRARALYLNLLTFKSVSSDPMLFRLMKPEWGGAGSTITHEEHSPELLDDLIIQHFCFQSRNFADSHPAIARFLKRNSGLSDGTKKQLSEQEIKLLLLCQTPGITLNELTTRCGYKGKKSMQQSLRKTLSGMMESQRAIDD